MTIKSVFQAIEALPSSTAFRESLNGYPFTLTAHVVSMCLFAGLIIMMDLRLVGYGFQKTPFSELQKRLFPWQMFGLVVSSISGGVLFYGQPMRYYGKALYWTKLSLMILAGINALVFHLTTYRSVRDWDTDPVPPVSARLAGYFGLFLWAGVVAFGRLTAYDWFTYR